jgi:SAM-dependent methyltransferase
MVDDTNAHADQFPRAAPDLVDRLPHATQNCEALTCGAMNCDRIARLYRWLEYAVFGRTLERARTALLGEISNTRRVLALGAGDGRALEALVAVAPGARIDYVDRSAKMLQLARTRVRSPRVNFRQADARQASFPDTEYDGLVTHFFFDCFDQQELPLVIANAAAAAAPEAAWIVSEFRPASPAARLLIAVMYKFFGAATGLKTRRLVDHHPLLERHGFRLARAQPAWGGMIVSEMWVRFSVTRAGSC